MTDRYHSLTVVLEHDIREDDAESLISAIQHLRGVLTVEGNVSGADQYVANQRAYSKLHDKVIESLREWMEAK